MATKVPLALTRRYILKMVSPSRRQQRDPEGSRVSLIRCILLIRVGKDPRIRENSDNKRTRTGSGFKRFPLASRKNRFCLRQDDVHRSTIVLQVGYLHQSFKLTLEPRNIILICGHRRDNPAQRSLSPSSRNPTQS